MHTELSDDAYEPAEHIWQVQLPAVAIHPAKHGMQLVRLTEEYFPVGHCMHTVSWVPLYVPFGQAVHDWLPCRENSPSWQLLQVELSGALSTDEKVFAEQFLQLIHCTST